MFLRDIYLEKTGDIFLTSEFSNPASYQHKM